MGAPQARRRVHRARSPSDLRDHVDYYQSRRTRLTLDKDAPISRQWSAGDTARHWWRFPQPKDASLIASKAQRDRVDKGRRFCLGCPGSTETETPRNYGATDLSSVVAPSQSQPPVGSAPGLIPSWCPMPAERPHYDPGPLHHDTPRVAISAVRARRQFLRSAT